MTTITLAHLRRYAIARSLFAPTTLARAIGKLGFIQADPIRTPARAQDLTLRHRVKSYRAGDLERRYPQLDLEEGFFVNYGFLHRTDYLRMHPRVAPRKWDAATQRRVQAMLAFIRARGMAHPREIGERFAHGKATNNWGGSSNATTQLLGGMHYRGLHARRQTQARLLRVAAAVARSGDRLVQCEPHRRAARLSARLCRSAAARYRVQTRTGRGVGATAPVPRVASCALTG